MVYPSLPCLSFTFLIFFTSWRFPPISSGFITCIFFSIFCGAHPLPICRPPYEVGGQQTERKVYIEAFGLVESGGGSYRSFAYIMWRLAAPHLILYLQCIIMQIHCQDPLA